MPNADKNNESRNVTLVSRLISKGLAWWNYCSKGVWNDSRRNWKVNFVKTVNLSVQSFLNQDLQSRACALTYRTVLALVPALALLFAIGRGFNLQDVLQRELISYFPAQRQTLEQAFGYVDAYLQQTSGGIFVGVGILFLLWTLISLLSSVETSFNTIWQVSKGRRLWRMITDYLAIFILLPVLMICGSGFSLLMTTSLKNLLPFDFIDSALSVIFDFAGIVFTWLFFAGSYLLIPNTKVKIKPAVISGIVVGTAYQVLQWLFVSGQMYVSKYNAIYGSFSFLPLMLIWLQLVWLITLIGAVMCYASQNISEFNYGEKIKNISEDYRMQVSIIIMAIISKRFYNNEEPVTTYNLASDYGIPINMAKPLVEGLYNSGLITYLQSSDNDISTHKLNPAMEVSSLTVGDVMKKIYEYGDSKFISGLEEKFPDVFRLSSQVVNQITASADALIMKLAIPKQ